MTTPNTMDREPIFSLSAKDFEVTWFSGTGAGGQYRNRHKNCCRIKHKATGVIGTGQSNRNMKANQTEAFNSLMQNPKFRNWLDIQISEALYGVESLDDLVNKAMTDIKVEVMKDGEWVEE